MTTGIGTVKGIEITGTVTEIGIGTGIETGIETGAAMQTTMVVLGLETTEKEIAIGTGIEIDEIAGPALYRNEAITSITRPVVHQTSETTETANDSSLFLERALKKSCDEAAQGNNLMKEIGVARAVEALALVKIEIIMEVKTR